MILCIESWKGDVLLSGKTVPVSELKHQLRKVNKLYDPTEDNFSALLCRMYHWEVIEDAADIIPDATFDRDTSILLPLLLI